MSIGGGFFRHQRSEFLVTGTLAQLSPEFSENNATYTLQWTITETQENCTIVYKSRQVKTLKYIINIPA